MAFAIEHTVTIKSPLDGARIVRGNSCGETRAPYGMDFVIAEEGEGEDVRQELLEIKADATVWGDPSYEDWDCTDLQNWLNEHQIAGEIEWAKDAAALMAEGLIEPMKDVPAVRWREEAGRTYRIEEVPIFELGPARGFDFTPEWADRLITRFREDAVKGCFPALIKGHNAEGADERPAVGRLENLRRAGARLYADLAGIGRDMFDEIRQGKWPQRSIEVFPQSAALKGLALLGESRPFHKFPALGHFAEIKEQPMHFAWRDKDDDGGDAANTSRGADDGTQNKAADAAGRMDMGEDKKPDTGGTPPAKVDEPEVDYAAKFAEQEATNAQQAKELAELTERQRQTDVERFKEDLRGMGYAPGIVDSDEIGGWIDRASRSETVIKFGEAEVSGLEAPKAVLTLFAEKAKVNALWTPPTGQTARIESAEGPDGGLTDEERQEFGEDVDMESVRRNREIEKIAEEKKISFSEARDIYRRRS